MPLPKTKLGVAYALAREEIGTKEIPGESDNPTIVQYFEDVGHSWVEDDETAWCAAFVGSMLKRAGLPHTGSLRARSYESWGNHVNEDDAREGDLVVFWRVSPDSGFGHVGFMVRQTAKSILVLSGNQTNMVKEQWYPKSKFIGYRRMDDIPTILKPVPPTPLPPSFPSEGNRWGWLGHILSKLFGRSK